MGFEGRFFAEVDAAVEEASEFFFEDEEAEAEAGMGFKFDEEVDVGIRAKFTADRGAEDGKLLDVVVAAQSGDGVGGGEFYGE